MFEGSVSIAVVIVVQFCMSIVQIVVLVAVVVVDEVVPQLFVCHK